MYFLTSFQTTNDSSIKAPTAAATLTTILQLNVVRSFGLAVLGTAVGGELSSATGLSELLAVGRMVGATVLGEGLGTAVIDATREGTRVEGMAVTVGGTVVGSTVATVGLGVIDVSVGNRVGASVVGECVVGFKVGAAVGGRVGAGSGGGVRTGGCRQVRTGGCRT